MQKKILISRTIKGVASYYHPRFVGRETANGEVFSNDKYTAASNHFDLGTYVKVTNTRNGRFIYVKINDRMGQPGRVIDLTHRAAEALHFVSRGLTKVTIEPVPASMGRQAILAQRESDDAALPDNAM
ncbi:MAG TPA: septal ring lytic transglycosylase RlpA family protein [Edaphocola sp.]|nr:septal ring lytic transglycosylase RlpA family protein [Edaphocola sp.]